MSPQSRNISARFVDTHDGKRGVMVPDEMQFGIVNAETTEVLGVAPDWMQAERNKEILEDAHGVSFYVRPLLWG